MKRLVAAAAAGNPIGRPIGFLLAALLLTAAPAFADSTVHTLLNAVTSPTTSSSVHAASGESGRETWTFLFTSSGPSGAAVVEMSLDGGTTFTPIHYMPAASSIFQIPACGGCYLRTRTTRADAADAVTVTQSVSGAIVAAVVAP